jgi:hypothetical protein
MKLLLILSAIFEMITGLALVIVPTLPMTFLLGVSLQEPGGILLGRIAGLALISLALACWLSRKDAHGGRIMTRSMMVYNIGTTVVLAYAGLGENLSGVGLWPAALLHVGLAFWCLKYTLYVKES